MPPSTALHTIGFYCGRHGSGFFDEPQNSFSNAAFLLGAIYCHHLLRKRVEPDAFLLLLTVLLGSIGVGSFVFHSYPIPLTLYFDLVPIQLFVLAIGAYLLVRVIGASWRAASAVLLAFFLFRQLWIAVVPGWILGGGVTHIPTVMALLALVATLAQRGNPVWRYLIAGALCYVGALLIRTWDIPLCSEFPFGLHWAWHISAALAGTLVLVGILQHSNRPAKSVA